MTTSSFMFRNSSKVSTSPATRRPLFLLMEAVVALLEIILASRLPNPQPTLLEVVAPLETRRGQMAVSDTHKKILL